VDRASKNPQIEETPSRVAAAGSLTPASKTVKLIAMTPQASTRYIAVGPFLLNTPGRRLLRDGVEVKLRPQTFNALLVLAENASHDMDYNQLIREAWGGVCVSRHTLEVTIAEVKKVLGEYGSWISRRPKLGYRLEIPESDELIRRGWHFWNQRTHEALERALDCFLLAARENDSDFRACEGLAHAYLMLGLYGVRPPGQMRECFLEAHRRAVSLIGWTPELRCAWACWLHMFERRYEESESAFLQTLRDNPDLVLAYIRLALLYTTLGRFNEALEVLLGARDIDPLYPSLPGTEAFIRLSRREIDAAVKADPQSPDAHNFRGTLLARQGDLDQAIREYAEAIRLRPDFGLAHLNAGRILASKGDKAGAEQHLRRALADEDPNIRRQAAAELQRLGVR